jgi:hypothetical protein
MVSKGGCFSTDLGITDHPSAIDGVVSGAAMFVFDYMVRVAPHILSGDPSVVHGTVWSRSCDVVID